MPLFSVNFIRAPRNRSQAIRFNDTVRLFFGNSDDAFITYDGVNMILNPKSVGGGFLSLLADLQLEAGSDLRIGAVEILTDSPAGTANLKNIDSIDATTLATIVTALGGTLALVTGVYTGDGSTSQAITGLGIQPKFLVISRSMPTDGNATLIMLTSDVIMDDNASGGAIDLNIGGFEIDAIIALGADGFTVDDGGVDNRPNELDQLYNFAAWG